MLFGLIKKKHPVKDPEHYNKNVIQRGNEFLSSSSMLLDKEITGEFYCLEEVVVDNVANVIGNIMTMRCVIKGKITGNVLCLKNVTIKSTAIIEGEITAGTVEVESGAVINGCITLQRDLQAPNLIQKVKECESVYNRPKVPVLRSTELPVVPTEEKKEPASKPAVGINSEENKDKNQTTPRHSEPLDTKNLSKTLSNNSSGAKWW